MHDDLTQYPECGLLQRVPVLPPGGMRCGCVLYRDRPDSLNRTLALTIAGLTLFAIANGFPFLSFSMQGQVTRRRRSLPASWISTAKDSGRSPRRSPSPVSWPPVCS